ncbi:AAA family ATPase [Microbacterium sp. NPDC058342]|uniref:AAA family ATPase n=1 Tax=Microbacterium sp. NPDC058342 TaxID=3346454 RepID=UPI0036697E88
MLPHPHPPVPRVLIAGVTGSGKTTFARRLASAWDLRHVEIDALFHGPDWTPRESFLDDVTAFAAEERWVTEWQYTSRGTSEILAPRAELVVWLDYPYRVVRSRLIRRTFGRAVLRTELWNGNRERGLTNMFHPDPHRNILAWQTRTLRHWSERMPALREQYPHLEVIRFGHPRAADRWLSAVSVL